LVPQDDSVFLDERCAPDDFRYTLLAETMPLAQCSWCVFGMSAEQFAAAHYWCSRCYSWPSGAQPCTAQRSEVVNNSAAAEFGAVESSSKILSH